MRCRIDHLVVTAHTLAEGAAYVQSALGLALQEGGEHPAMGTHNLLLRLGDTAYLEVIAVNPRAPRPPRPRWFELDARDEKAEPRLATWVARTDDIEAASAASPIALGTIEPMSRGALQWRITLPGDGRLPLSGLAPALIQWFQEPHPASGLEDRGASLRHLEAFHPDPERVGRLYECLGLEDDVSVSKTSGEPHLVAHVNTPAGVRRL